MRIGEYPKLLYRGGNPALDTMDVWNAEEEAEGNTLGFRQFRPGQEVPDVVQIEEAEAPKTRVKRRVNRNRDNQ